MNDLHPCVPQAQIPATIIGTCDRRGESKRRRDRALACPGHGREEENGAGACQYVQPTGGVDVSGSATAERTESRLDSVWSALGKGVCAP